MTVAAQMRLSAAVSISYTIALSLSFTPLQLDHYGPINVYMAAVSDATTAVGSSASWFKMNEMGLPSSNPDYWATEVLNVSAPFSSVLEDVNFNSQIQDNCGHYTVTIPKDIAPGNYLLRAEVIGKICVRCLVVPVANGNSALHVASCESIQAMKQTNKIKP